MEYTVQKEKIKYQLIDEVQVSAFLNSGYKLIKIIDDEGKEIKDLSKYDK